jgi:hypothetical protein
VSSSSLLTVKRGKNRQNGSCRSVSHVANMQLRSDSSPPLISSRRRVRCQAACVFLVPLRRLSENDLRIRRGSSKTRVTQAGDPVSRPLSCDWDERSVLTFHSSPRRPNCTATGLLSPVTVTMHVALHREGLSQLSQQRPVTMHVAAIKTGQWQSAPATR